MPTPSNLPSSALACVPPPPSDRESQASLIANLRKKVVRMVVLEDGLKLTFAPERGRVLEIGRFLEIERHCCPFFSMTLEVEADGGPVHLTVSGPKEAQEMIRDEILAQQGIDVPVAALTGGRRSIATRQPRAGRGYVLLGGAGMATGLFSLLCCLIPAAGLGGAATLSGLMPAWMVNDGFAATALGAGITLSAVGLFTRHRRKRSTCGC